MVSSGRETFNVGQVKCCIVVYEKYMITLKIIPKYLNNKE